MKAIERNRMRIIGGEREPRIILENVQQKLCNDQSKELIELADLH